MPPPEIPIEGGETAKVRSPVNSALLSLIPFYGLFWYFYINKELAALGRARGTEELGTNPTNSALALFPGGLVIVPAVISMYNTGERMQAAQRLTGVGETVNSAIVCVALLIFFPAGVFYVQQELNKAWESLQGGGGQLPGGPPAAEAQPAPAQPATQEQPPAAQ
jgi:hypothetical protein